MHILVLTPQCSSCYCSRNHSTSYRFTSMLTVAFSSLRTTSSTALVFPCSVLISAAPRTSHVRICPTTWRRAVAARWSFAPSRRPAANTEWVLRCKCTEILCCPMQFYFLHTCKNCVCISKKKNEAYSRRLFLRVGCRLWDFIFASFWDQGSLGKQLHNIVTCFWSPVFTCNI